MYRDARKGVGLSTEEAAHRLHIARRTLCKYESGESTPPPEVVGLMSKEYDAPWLTQLYCKQECAIGKTFSYEILDNVDRSLTGILSSLEEELEEALAVITRMRRLAKNKESRDEFPDEEWEEFHTDIQQLLDVEHNVETLKLTLGKFCDVSSEVKEHNEKCIAKKYATECKSSLISE